MRRNSLLARLFRALSGKTQQEFSELTGVHPSLLADYELDDADASVEHLERLAAGAGLTIPAGEQILRFAELLRRPRQRAGQGLGELLDRLRTLVSCTYQRLQRLSLPGPVPRPEDRRRAEEQWLLLAGLTEDQQMAVVRVAREFQNWALAVRFCDESERAASKGPKRAAGLARCAVEIAERVRGGPDPWLNRLRGYAGAHPPNVRRVAGELKEAEAGLERAKRLWQAGADPYGLLDPGRLLDLEASLRRAQRRFAEALALLNEAREVSWNPGRILVKKGFTLEVMGEYQQALEALLEAGPLVERQGDPRLFYMQRFNVAVVTVDLGRFGEGRVLARQVRELAAERGDSNELIRVTWLEGRIAAGLGRSEEALALLEQARQGFAAREMWYDVALALLEIAVLLLVQGRTAEVKLLAEGLTEVFAAQDIHQEALAALRLFQEAAKREEATADLARRVLQYLFRARHDQGLRFTDS